LSVDVYLNERLFSHGQALWAVQRD
jgi:hypothetical protein